MLATEILYNIFSYLSYTETYRNRSVCRLWKQHCEYHIYATLKSRKQNIHVKLGDKRRSVEISLTPSQFDDQNGVVQFVHSAEEENDGNIYLDPKTNKYGQVLFSEWCERTIVDPHIMKKLTLPERALVLFHLKYNPSLERIYEIPISAAAEKDEYEKLRYIGDKGMIMEYSYSYFSSSDTFSAVVPEINFQEAEDSVLPSVFNEALGSTAVSEQSFGNLPYARLRIHSVYANISWLLSGINPDISPETIYPDRYQKLIDRMKFEGIQTYSRYSEAALSYIVNQDNDDMKQKYVTMLNQTESRIEQLRIRLSPMGIDPRAIWKYNFAKNFILKKQNNMALDDVLYAIQKSEEEWVLKKLGIVHQLKEIQ